MTNGTQDDSRQLDIKHCYIICRECQNRRAKYVLRVLKDYFDKKTIEEILELVVEVEKITSQSSRPV